ncbi:MAG: ROK family protein, partial [Candidatus Omnitrophica bacterium]|nr:ROK family protein [Candidatus Omnitrophota bacterium]
MANNIYCGVDVGGTKILAALVDVRGKVLVRKKCATPQKVSSQRIYNEIRNHLQALFEENDVDVDELCGIGMGIPGIVMPNQTDILRTPNISLAKFPLAQRLSKYFGVRVILGNDVNLGLLGEKWLGAGQQSQNIIGLFPGTGVGGGIILDGKLLCGEQGVAGELGHVIIDQNSSQMSAGLPGTI